MKKYDYIIIGAGIYGMHAARYLGNKGYNICLVEAEGDAFTKASYINQARVHNGYHYPRSYDTAIKSKEYFDRFCNDFGFAINKDFKKIYAIAEKNSKTSPIEFEIFCKNVGIPCKKINSDLFFKQGIEATYETLEYSFDAIKIRDFMKSEVEKRTNIDCFYHTKITSVTKNITGVVLSDQNGSIQLQAKTVINATYAGINEIHELFEISPIDIKYEYTEIALCNVNKELSNYGITIMDGDYCSIMPFGIGGKFSITSVKYTPHEECHKSKPYFKCLQNDYLVPETNFNKMKEQAMTYLRDEIKIQHDKSFFTTKTILASTEFDDARPTLINKYDLGDQNTLITIFSGKINTIYEIEKYLENN